MLHEFCYLYVHEYLTVGHEYVSYNSTHSEKKIKLDTYIPPYANVEMAILCLEQRRIEDVKRYLEKAK